MDPTKTWSIVADKLGSHWHTTVRRGVEGSRARIGELKFDISDVENAKITVELGCDRVVTRTIGRTIEQLAKDNLLRCEPGPTLSEIARIYGEIIRPECRELLIEHLVHYFGMRIDLAKVGFDRWDVKPCPPGAYCVHEPKCKGCI